MAVASTQRKDPCKVCKFSRKKCRWKNDGGNECDRCHKMGLECFSSDDSDDIDLYTTEDGDGDLQSWRSTLDQLDSDLKKTQQNVAQMWWQSSLEWKLTLTDGSLQLETPIRSMEELFMFTQASIRYLSPFSGLFMKQPVLFSSTTLSLALGVSSVIQRKELMNPRKKRLFLLENNDNNVTDLPTSDHRAIIDRLVMLYLKHYNPYIGLVHRATFLEHYRSIDNPMDSALTLALCVDALFRVRHLISYTPYEASMLAELFYARCRDLLFDMYEDPARKVDIVVISSLITKYVSDLLLNQLESNRIVAVALLICMEFTNCRNRLTPVQWVLLQRNYVHLQLYNRQYLMLYEDKVDFSLLAPLGDIETLDDEPEVTRNSMRLVNEIFHLIGSPYISYFLGKVNDTFYGKPCEILIEDIVRFEPMVKTWWDDLPPHFRICDDPFDSDGYKLVEGAVPANHLVPFITLHLLVGLLTSSILQPHVMATSEDCATADAIQVVKRRLVSLALNSCKVTVYALNDNWIPSVSDIPSFGLIAIKFGIYFMEKLAKCDDVEFPVELFNMLKKSLEGKAKSLIPAGHEVPFSSSILASYRENVNKPHFEIYEQYPIPGYAMLSDTLFSSINSIAEQNLKVSF